MAKLKLLSQHKIEDIPDHILEEVTRSCAHLVVNIIPLIDAMPANIALNAMQWANAVIIKHLVTNHPDEMRKAAKWVALELIKNVDKLIDQMESEKNG